MLNRVLTDIDREKYKTIVEDMFATCPAMMKRKIPRSYVQQAFVVDTIIQTGIKDNILCVGCYEDTAYEYLRAKGWNILGIDPQINYDLYDFIRTTKRHFFDIVFATSVLEHVQEDELFISDICRVLAVGGLAILTMDFQEGWEPGDAKPSSDFRLYTERDYKRLMVIAARDDCYLVDEFVSDAVPDFEFEKCKYNFSTMVFRRVK